MNLQRILQPPHPPGAAGSRSEKSKTPGSFSRAASAQVEFMPVTREASSVSVP